MLTGKCEQKHTHEEYEIAKQIYDDYKQQKRIKE